MVEKVLDHRRHLQKRGGWRERELNRSRQEIEKLLQSRFMRQMMEAIPQHDRDQLVEAVADRKLDPYAAVKQIFAEIEENGWVP